MDKLVTINKCYCNQTQDGEDLLKLEMSRLLANFLTKSINSTSKNSKENESSHIEHKIH